MGTRINGLKLTKVVDGDTVKVEIEGQVEDLRLLCIDTEESNEGGSKPVTEAGKEASRLAKAYFGCDADGIPQGDVRVDIEFDTSHPEHACLQRHRGTYGRLLCYVHKDGANYNLMTVREGWSPYSVKYGRSRLYHHLFIAAEVEAQRASRLIWDPVTNAGGDSRDYSVLIPSWHLRDSVVLDCRYNGMQAGVLSLRLDYADIVTAANNVNIITALCDLQHGAVPAGNGALMRCLHPSNDFNLWIPNRTSDAAQTILRLIEKRYAGQGRWYVYVSGRAVLYDGKPEIVLTDVAQLSDITPGN